MMRVGFVGVPGSGKTSTSRALAAYCRRNEQLKRVELVAEYARRYIAKYGIDSMWDQIKILDKQTEWEDAMPVDKTDLLITDCPVFLGFAYCLDLRARMSELVGVNPEQLKKLGKENMLITDIFKKMSKLNVVPRYDIIFHMGLELKPVDDGVRAKHQFDDAWRQDMDEKIRCVFNLFPPRRYVRINTVGMEDRVNECLGHLQSAL